MKLKTGRRKEIIKERVEIMKMGRDKQWEKLNIKNWFFEKNE
jgi:hypothetical protein